MKGIFQLLLVSIITSILFLYLTKKLFPFRPGRKLPPGSKGWFFLGELLDLRSKYKDGVLQNFVLERCQKYSSNVFKTSIIGQPIVVFSGAEGNKFLFSNQKDLFKHFLPGPAEKMLGNFNKILDYTDQAAPFRKFLKSTLKGDSQRDHLGIFNAMIKQQTSDWNTTDHDHDPDQRVMDRVDEMARREMEDESKFDGLQQGMEILAIGIASIHINFPGTEFNRGMKASKKLRKEILAIVRNQSKTRTIPSSSSSSSAGGITGTLPSLVQSLFDVEGVNFTNEVEMAALVLGLLLGAYLGVRIVATNVFKYLAEFPEFYVHLLKEQGEITRSKAPNEALHLEDLRKMKYSWKVICETLRFLPLVGGFKEAITDFKYGEYTIPKGWKIHWNMEATHHNPEYFPNPDKFDP